MSEPNFPLKPQAEPGLESSLDWWNPFPELTDTELAKTETYQDPSEPPDNSAREAVSQVASPANTPANPLANSLANDGLATDQVSQVPNLDAAEPLTSSTEPPNLIDLISLIQELNQCNGVLLDRVSQLEDALERSQQALQGQMARSPEAFAAPEADDLATAQAQVANLFSQLEFAHQTNQRQHILIETLTAELESSQERVAQLEREAALLQQRYNDQTQLLVQSEGTCRDLQARLQRQQRYTLQFKAALEKCLEMPMPQTGAEMVAPPVDSLLLPKAQQIQPWSQTAAQESLLPWMKRFKSPAEGFLAEDSESFAAEESRPEVALTASVNAIEPSVRPSLSAIQLPVLTPLTPDAAPTADNLPETLSDSSVEDPEAIADSVAQAVQQSEPSIELSPAETAAPASISYDLKTQAGIVPPTTLLTRLDAVVQPLADRLAEALLSQAAGQEAVIEAAQPRSPEVLPELPPAEPQIKAIAEADDVIISDADSLLASAMSEAEDALWQDLARLIEVSPEAAVKASLTGDLAAFESLNFEGIAADASAVLPASQADRLQAAFPDPAPQPVLPKSQPSKTGSPAGANVKLPVTAPAPEASLPVTPNSPSPLLHPPRPTKPKRSLSSVELPSFLRQEDSKPLPT